MSSMATLYNMLVCVPLFFRFGRKRTLWFLTALALTCRIISTFILDYNAMATLHFLLGFYVLAAFSISYTLGIEPEVTYRQTSNIRRIKSQTLNVSRFVLLLPLPNPVKPGDVPTISECSTILLPTKGYLMLEVWRQYPLRLTNGFVVLCLLLS